MDSIIPSTAPRILVIEDSPGHRELLKEALQQHGLGSAARFEQDAESASTWLRGQADSAQLAPLALVLLDLKLKGESGLTFLRRLRTDHRLGHLPVVIITTSDDSHDIDASYAAGANGYVVKPETFGGLIALVGDLCRYWLNWNRCSEAAALRGA